MKNILFIIIAFIVSACTIESSEKETKVNTLETEIPTDINYVRLYEKEIKNHTYIIIRYGGENATIVHAEHCKCWDNFR